MCVSVVFLRFNYGLFMNFVFSYKFSGRYFESVFAVGCLSGHCELPWSINLTNKLFLLLSSSSIEILP